MKGQCFAQGRPLSHSVTQLWNITTFKVRETAAYSNSKTETTNYDDWDETQFHIGQVFWKASLCYMWDKLCYDVHDAENTEKIQG